MGRHRRRHTDRSDSLREHPSLRLRPTKTKMHLKKFGQIKRPLALRLESVNELTALLNFPFTLYSVRTPAQCHPGLLFPCLFPSRPRAPMTGLCAPMTGLSRRQPWQTAPKLDHRT